MTNPWDPTAPRNAFERATTEYRDFRPSYPVESVRAALWPDAGNATPPQAVPDAGGANPARGSNQGSATRSFLRGDPDPSVRPANSVHNSQGVDAGGVLDVVDIGAGTGKFTGQLMCEGARVTAVEPAAAMRAQLADLRCRVVDGTAEATGLPDACADVVTYAQSWHWLDAPAALAEARRLLRPGGHVAIVFNQMDVSVPWVHRLTRIMRSGDIHTPEKVPEVGSGWTAPKLHRADFSTKLKPAEVMGLARTRSSYLKSTKANRARMQGNLAWYLRDHLGYGPEDLVEIPYYTLVWVTRPML